MLFWWHMDFSTIICLMNMTQSPLSKSDNMVVKTIVNMGLHGSYSVIGGNKRYLENNFSFSVNDVNKSWSDIYSENLARTAEHVEKK